jgi:choline dehydrogenase
MKRVTVQKVLFDGQQATGVEYLQASQMKQVYVSKEVILSAGSVGSPQLLQLSGVGPAQVLADAHVPLVHDLPGVGENLQDHLEVYFQYRCNQPISLNSKLDYFNMGLIGARWLLTKTGLGATNHFESCGFIRSRAGLKWPNIQYHFLPAAMRYDGNAAFDGHGYQVHVGPNKPSSRGHIRIVSNKASDSPEIVFNYIGTEQDKQDWRDCIRLTRELLNQPALDPFKGEEIQPGPNVQTDDEIDAWVKENVESAYHPSCTCKMGADEDVMAVLDSECKVRGLKGLRVVDSSIFPVITNGNLNAPTIMVAEKAADLILGKTPLTPADANVWIADQWQHLQRTGTPVRTFESMDD